MVPKEALFNEQQTLRVPFRNILLNVNCRPVRQILVHYIHLDYQLHFINMIQKSKSKGILKQNLHVLFKDI